MAETSAPSNPIVFTLTIPWADAAAAYEKRLAEVISHTTIKGFRPGKAPKKLVEDTVGKSKLLSQVIEDVLPSAYQNEVKKRNLRPMIAPRVKPIAVKEREPWKFEITLVQKPTVRLGDYQDVVKKALAPAAIITTASQSPPSPTNDKETQEKRLSLVFDALLKTVEAELPQLLVDEEVNLRLAQLIDELRSLGMTIEDYLRAKNLSAERLRADYERTAREMLRLNLALDAVATEKQFTDKDRIAKTVSWLTQLK